MSRVYAASAASAVVLAAVAFLAKGGSELGRTTVAELLLVGVGAALVAAALLSRRRGPLYGAVPVLLFAALTGITALSVKWSVVPELSFVEAGRAFSYLAVFAGAVALARLAPRASPVLIRGVLAAAVAICAYALASRVWPGALAQNEFYARVGQPFGYWNAVGATAALGLVPALWLGARRPGSMLERALAFPAAGVLVLSLLLTQSRGALGAAVVALLVWFVFVPLRLRSLAVLVVGSLGAAPVAAWALSESAFTVNFTPLAERQAVAGEFGLLLLLMLALLTVAGLAAAYGMTRIVPSMRLRRGIGLVAVAAVLAAPLALFTSLASSDRGLSGTISDRIGELTNESAEAPPEGAGRLTAASSSRARYWREAIDVFGERPVTGTGAGAYYISRLRYRKDELVARHAHGYVPQTMSDLGLLGLGTSLLLLVAWVATALRATALTPRLRRRSEPRPPVEWSGERVALLGLVAVVVAFGVQSAVDWTWFVPGTAVVALAAAGFLAGRGTLGVSAPSVPSERPAWSWRRPAGLRAVAATGVLVTAGLFAWAIWQPERASRANDRALSQLERGDLSAAAADVKRARSADPLSPRPRFVASSIAVAAGRSEEARQTLERTVLTFPGDPQTWLRLAEFEFNDGKPRRTLEVVRGALYLDPFSKAARRLRERARAAALAELDRRRGQPGSPGSPAGPGAPGAGGTPVGSGPGGAAGTPGAGGGAGSGSGSGGAGGGLGPAQGTAQIPPDLEGPAEYLGEE
jgi:hypothetical protein